MKSFELFKIMDERRLCKKCNRQKPINWFNKYMTKSGEKRFKVCVQCSKRGSKNHGGTSERYASDASNHLRKYEKMRSISSLDQLLDDFQE